MVDARCHFPIQWMGRRSASASVCARMGPMACFQGAKSAECVEHRRLTLDPQFGHFDEMEDRRAQHCSFAWARHAAFGTDSAACVDYFVHGSNQTTADCLGFAGPTVGANAGESGRSHSGRVTVGAADFVGNGACCEPNVANASSAATAVRVIVGLDPGILRRQHARHPAVHLRRS